MAIKLKFTDIVRPTAMLKRQRPARDVVVQALDEQIALLDATTAGRPFEVTRERYRKVDGKSTKVTVNSRPRPWWFDADGRFYAELRHGVTPVDLSGRGQTVFECGAKLDEVGKTFKQLRESVAAGEFDQQIAAAKAKAGRKAA